MPVHLDELHTAIERGSVRVVREYLAGGGAVGDTEKAGWTPLDAEGQPVADLLRSLRHRHHPRIVEIIQKARDTAAA